MKKILLSLSILMFISMICFGQSGSGSIRGTVKSAEGEVLPGILVTLTSPSIVVKQLTALTNENGVYRFVALLPGTYQVKFELEGMQTSIRKGIRVLVGKTMTIDGTLNLKTISESIVVEGKANTIDRQATTGVTSMDLEFLKAIPTRDRDVAGFFNMTPGVTGSTAHGSNQMSNAYLVDGVNMGDPATGMNSITIGADIMEEVAVQSGGISAEYGSVQGAVVNIVTKSGGNKFSGTTSFLYNHESLQSDNTKGTDLEDPDNTVKTGEKFKYEPVFTLGGPVIKDKLWFFINLSMTKSEEYEPNYPALSDIDIPVDHSNVYPYLKLTFQPSQNDKFTFSYNFSKYKSNHRDAAWNRTEDNTYIQTSPKHVFNLHWTKTFGDSFYTNLKFAMVDSFMGLKAKGVGMEYMNTVTGINSGPYWRNEDNNYRDRYQVNFDATTYIDDLAGSHELKIGGELQIGKDNWIVKTADTPGPPVDGMIFGGGLILGDPNFNMGYNFNGGFDRETEMQNISFFINDTWSVTNNLTLTLGVRYDDQRIIWPAQQLGKTEVWNPNGAPFDFSIPEKVTPMKWNNITPRLGLVYDIFSDGTTLFKASYSKYVQPNQTGWVNIAHPNGWYAWWILTDKEWNPVGAPNMFWMPGSDVEIGYKDYDLSAPVTDEITVGIERELFEDWSIGLRYIKKKDKNNVHQVDAADIDIDALMNNGELNWIDYQLVTGIDPYNNSEISFYDDLNPNRIPQIHIVNPPGAERKYDGLELTINKRYSKGYALNLSYVYANSRGLVSTQRGGQALGTSGLYGSPNAHINMDGRLFLEKRHQIKLTGLVKGPFGINMSGYFRYYSGRRRTRQVGSGDIGLGDLGTGDQVIINAEERGSTALPNQYLLDLRIEKAFKIKNIQISIFADIFNVLNANFTTDYKTDRSSHPSTDWDWQTTATILQPRVARLGAKIEF